MCSEVIVSVKSMNELLTKLFVLSWRRNDYLKDFTGKLKSFKKKNSTKTQTCHAKIMFNIVLMVMPRSGFFFVSFQSISCPKSSARSLHPKGLEIFRQLHSWRVAAVCVSLSGLRDFNAHGTI